MIQKRDGDTGTGYDLTNELLEPDFINSFDIITIGSFANNYGNNVPIGTKNDSIGVKQIVELTLSASSISSGTITISLNNLSQSSAPYEFVISTESTVSEVMNKIKNTGVPNFDIQLDSDNNKITFISRVGVPNSAPTFDGGTTGVSGAMQITQSGVQTLSTTWSQLKYVLTYLSEYCPSKRIFMFSNIQFGYNYENWGWGGANTVGATAQQYADAMKEACDMFGIYYVDMFNSGGVNEINKNAYYYSVDYTHPTPARGMRRMAECLYHAISNYPFE